MQTFIRKITSRKFLAALAGVATGLGLTKLPSALSRAR